MNTTFRTQAGYTILELLIALLLTGIVAAAGFSFYVSTHNTALTQEEISNMQNVSRSSLQEMARQLRMAGYKLTGHVPFRINGDSLYVFYSDTQPVDTVLYYLQLNATLAAQSPTGWKPMQLMKKVNSQPAAVFSDIVHSIDYNVIDSATVEITIEAQTGRADEALSQNSGYRSLSVTERVNIRNVAI